MAVPSVYHVLTTLIEAGYVVHLSQEHRYGLGYRVRMLDRALHRQLAVDDDVAEVVRRLHVEADAAAYYAVYRDYDVVVVHVADSPRRPRIRALDVGFHDSAHATAFGKVMLAGMAPEQRDAYLEAAGLSPLTEATIVDRDRLESQLRHVHEANIALEMG